MRKCHPGRGIWSALALLLTQCSGSGGSPAAQPPSPPAITSPSSGTATTDAAVTVSGTASAGASVDVFDGAAPAGTATADPGGAFSRVVQLAVGVHALTATQTVGGLTSAHSPAVSVTIAPGAPAIASPADGATTTDGAVVVSGSAIAGAIVTVLDGAAAVANATADGAGAFSTSVPLAIGPHALTAKQTVAGVTSAASGAVSVTVAPAAPAITAPSTGTTATGSSVAVAGAGLPGASIAILDGGVGVATATADGAGSFSATVPLGIGVHALSATQTVNGVASAASTPVALTIAPPPPTLAPPAGPTVGATVTLTGTALRGAVVRVVADSGASATVAADAAGAFSATLALDIGAHGVLATQTVNGVTSASSAASVTVAPPAPTIASPAVGTVVTGAVAVTGTAIAGASVGILDGTSTPVATATADASGNYSVTVPLAAGSHAIAAEQTVNLVTSAPSAPVSIRVLAAPQAVVSSLVGPSTLTVVGASLYYTTDATGSCYAAAGTTGDAVWKVPADGSSSPAKVDDVDHYGGNCGVFAIVADSTYLYWLDYADATIKRRRLDLADAAVALYGGGAYGSAMIMDPGQGSLYWHLYGTDFVDRSPIPAAGATVQFTANMGSGYHAINFAVDATALYYTDYEGTTAGYVYEVPLGAAPLPATPTVIASGQYAPVTPAVTATTVYWLNGATSAGDDGALVSAPLAGGAPSVVLGSLVNPIRLRVDATDAYVLSMGTAPDYADGAIVKVPLAGGAPEVVAEGLYRPRDLALDESHVYWATSSTTGNADAQILRIPK